MDQILGDVIPASPLVVSVPGAGCLHTPAPALRSPTDSWARRSHQVLISSRQNLSLGSNLSPRLLYVTLERLRKNIKLSVLYFKLFMNFLQSLVLDFIFTFFLLKTGIGRVTGSLLAVLRISDNARI